MIRPTPPPRYVFDDSDEWSAAHAKYLDKLEEYDQWCEYEMDRRRDEHWEDDDD